MIDTSSSPPNSQGKMLPIDFVPSRHSVIIGRAKECKEASGNKRLRMLATKYLSKYSNAINRCVKSRVVSTIVEMVRSECPTGAFIKKVGKMADGSTGWMEVGESAAREKVGYVFRDLLSDQYRSSSKSKSLIRLKLQREQAKQGMEGSTSFSPDTAVSNSFRFPTATLDSSRLSKPMDNNWGNVSVSRSAQENGDSSALGKVATLDFSHQSLRSSLAAMLTNAASPFAEFDTSSTFTTSVPKDFEPTPIIEPTPMVEKSQVIHIPAVRRKSDFQWMDALASKLTNGAAV
eukprot:scaffold10330_cov98-Cylindrotheca_fusiformis.AAC.1